MQNYNNIFEKDGLAYFIYRQLIDKLLLQNKTTGPDNSENMLHYTKLNVQRMVRGDKTVILMPELVAAIPALEKNYKLLVITEGWCGDAAQIVPIFNKIASAAPEKLKLKFVLRDQHLPLIDEHLTNSGRAIPVLLILDEEGNLVLPKWGPRPKLLQELITAWKAEGIVAPKLAEKIHAWYAKDKSQTTQLEILAIIQQLA